MDGKQVSELTINDFNPSHTNHLATKAIKFIRLMKQKISNAQPWIISVLCLLLGLSIGQIQRQHRQIHDLEHARFSTAIMAPPSPHHPDIVKELFREREQMLLEKDRMLNELHREIERAREEAQQ